MTITLQLLSFTSIIVGMLLLHEKIRVGWLVYELSGACLIWLYVRTGLYVLIAAQFIFMALNLRGWMRWKNEPILLSGNEKRRRTRNAGTSSARKEKRHLPILLGEDRGRKNARSSH